MLSVTIERLTGILEDYARRTGASIDILLIGGLALQAYGYSDRATAGGRDRCFTKGYGALPLPRNSSGVLQANGELTGTRRTTPSREGFRVLERGRQWAPRRENGDRFLGRDGSITL